MFTIYIKIFSMIFWLLPLKKQFGGNFFVFFLILAVLDPINFVNYYLFKISPEYLKVIASILLFLFVNTTFSKEIFYKKYNLISLFIFICIWIISPLINYTVLVIHLFIFGKLVFLFINNLFNRKVINIFYLLLSIYEILIFSNLALVIYGTTINIEYFHLTIVFMSLFAIFFSFFSASDKKVMIPIGRDQELRNSL